jgi:hypothetical protein
LPDPRQARQGIGTAFAPRTHCRPPQTAQGARGQLSESFVVFVSMLDSNVRFPLNLVKGFPQGVSPSRRTAHFRLTRETPCAYCRAMKKPNYEKALRHYQRRRAKIKAAAAAGQKFDAIAARFRISRQRVGQIVSEKA